MMYINMDLLLQFTNFFEKKSATNADKSAANKSYGAIKIGIISNQQFTEELNKPVIKKIEKHIVHSSFMHNIWGADIADMHLTTKYKKQIRVLLSVIDIMQGFFIIPTKYKQIKVVNFTVDQ